MTITVLNSCGHESQVRTSSRKVPKVRREHAKSGLCRECWRLEQDRAAFQQSRHYGLAMLRGTDKQVSWATRIRLAHVHQMMIGISPWGTFYNEALGRFVGECNRKTAAAWWIENRINAPGRRVIALLPEGKQYQAEQTDANARLIAAAPELLEALQALLSHVEEIERPGTEHPQAHAAISKATGE